jgi:flagellar hook-associated protein 2
MSSISALTGSSASTISQLLSNNSNRISGLASGMDIDSIVSGLMAAAQKPLISLQQKLQILQWRQSDYQSISTSLQGLRSAASSLRLQGTFLAKSTTSSDSSIVTAAAGVTASNISYQVTVSSLATAATNVSAGALSASSADPIDPTKSLWSQKDKFLSGDFGWDGDHNFTFTINGQEFTFDGDLVSLNNVIEAVNGNEEAGVGIFYDASTDKVAISTTATGQNQPGAQIQVSGSFMTGALQIDEGNEQGGTDAQFSINGLSGITSHTNSYTVNGVTFSFNGADPGKTVTVGVSSNIDSVVDTIKDFIDKYNETLATINDKLTEQVYSDFAPLTDAQIEESKLTSSQIDAWQAKARSGLLQNDNLVQRALWSMRAAMTGIVSGLTGKVTVTSGTQSVTVVANSLSTIGITTGSYLENGKLNLNETRLREALQSNPQAVMDLFTKAVDDSGNQLSGSQLGIASQLYNNLNDYISRIAEKAGVSGSLYDDSFLGEEGRSLSTRISDLQTVLLAREQRYYTQFSVMEQVIATMNAQSTALIQMLNS